MPESTLSKLRSQILAALDTEHIARKELARRLGIDRLREIEIAVLEDLVLTGDVEMRLQKTSRGDIKPRKEYRLAAKRPTSRADSKPLTAAQQDDADGVRYEPVQE